ncbi:MAG: hypothetical protein KDC05_17410, partial [Bacteroidales bacterium]|nr:hypothetical protein [Bacteroidales bacterium]
HKVREMIQKTKKTGIETGTFIMLGYPGETMEDIHETVRHLKESQPDQFTINLAYPIKGTALYNTVENKITSETGWPLPLDRDIQFKRTYKPAFYNMAIRMVYNSVYADKYRKTGNGIEFIKHKMKSLAALLALQFLK